MRHGLRLPKINHLNKSNNLAAILQSYFSLILFTFLQFVTLLPHWRHYWSSGCKLLPRLLWYELIGMLSITKIVICCFFLSLKYLSSKLLLRDYLNAHEYFITANGYKMASA